MAMVALVTASLSLLMHNSISIKYHIKTLKNQ